MEKIENTFRIRLGGLSGKLFPLPLILLFFGSGCASSSRSHLSILPHEPITAEKPLIEFCKTWSHPTGANLSYLSTSPDGTAIALSTSSDQGRPSGFEGKMRFLNAQGKEVWSKWLKQPVKAQAVSNDGKLVAFSTFEDKSFVMNSKGEMLWSADHIGFPIFLNESKRVLILNDDDSDPEIAFYIYNLKGKEAVKGLIGKNEEAIDQHLSADERYLSMALNKRKWKVFDISGPSPKIFASGEAEGEIAATAFYSSANRKIAFFLFSNIELRGAQKLMAVDVPSGKIVWKISLDRHYENMKLLVENEKPPLLMLYSNSSRGQALAAYSAVGGLIEWTKAFPTAANYSSPFQVFTQNKKTGGFLSVILDRTGTDEDITTGTLHLYGINRKGNAIFEVPVMAEDGIYSYAVAPNNLQAYVGAGKVGESVLFSYKPCKP